MERRKCETDTTIKKSSETFSDIVAAIARGYGISIEKVEPGEGGLFYRKEDGSLERVKGV